MIAVLVLAGLIVLAAVGAFVWTAVRSAVRQAVDNARRADVTAAPVAHWTRLPDAPVPFVPVADADEWVAPYGADEIPVSEPVFGSAADGLRDALRADELRHKSY